MDQRSRSTAGEGVAPESAVKPTFCEPVSRSVVLTCSHEQWVEYQWWNNTVIGALLYMLFGLRVPVL